MDGTGIGDVPSSEAFRDGVRSPSLRGMEPKYQPRQQQVLPRLPSPRVARTGPHTGRYSYGYPGPDRPFPEPRRRTAPVDPATRPAPPAAIAAGVLGIAGALPLALLVGAAVALGGLWTDVRVEWWLYPLLAAPVAQVGSAIVLLTGRGWRLLVVSCLPATALFGYLLHVRFAEADGLGLGYVTFALGAPLPAMLLAATPPVRRWVAARRRARARARPADPTDPTGLPTARARDRVRVRQPG